jgi:hypothetical protein
MPSLSGILRIGVAAIGLFACSFLLGGLLSYRRISAKDMQLKDVVKRVHVDGSTIVNDYGGGAGKLAFERGFSPEASYADRMQTFQLKESNRDLKKCWGYYQDAESLVPDFNGCRKQFISSVGVCDPTTAKGSWVYPTEYQEDTFIEDVKANRRAAEKAGRQNGGEDGVYIASAIGAFVIGISVAWFANDQERKSVHVAALITLIIFIAMPYIWFSGYRDSVLIDYIECKGMSDLEYYGSKPAATCYTTDQAKYGWQSSQYLDRTSVEGVDAECSSFKQAECSAATDCTWVAFDVPAVDATSATYRKSRLTKDTCRSTYLKGYNVFKCSAVQAMWWEANGFQWEGATRKRASPAVTWANSVLAGQFDAHNEAKKKAVYTDFKLSAMHCLKLKESKCVVDISESLIGCTDSEENKPMCDLSDGGDIIYGPKISVYKRIAGDSDYDPNDAINDALDTYTACSANEVAYVELLTAYKLMEEIPTNCLSNQAGEGRSKFMDELLVRISMAQTGLILMMAEGGLIFLLLILEVLKCKKQQGAKTGEITPVTV